MTICLDSLTSLYHVTQDITAGKSIFTSAKHCTRFAREFSVAGILETLSLRLATRCLPVREGTPAAQAGVWYYIRCSDISTEPMFCLSKSSTLPMCALVALHLSSCVMLVLLETRSMTPCVNLPMPSPNTTLSEGAQTQPVRQYGTGTSMQPPTWRILLSTWYTNWIDPTNLPIVCPRPK